jgi:hypothetical protein
MDILELQHKLDQQAAWRKREIFQAHSLAFNAENEEAKKYLCRAWVLILYAHCDNFLKESSKHYVDFLQSNKPTNYKPELIWLAIKGKDALTDGSIDNYKDFTSFSHHDSYQLLDEKLMKAVFEKSSFKYKFLRFVCDWALQITFDHLSMSAFCRALKETRDSIAHGEERYIDAVADCLPWHEKTIEFIEALKDSLIENASKTASLYTP